MKKYFAILIILILPFAIYGQGLKNNPANRFGLSFYLGANIPVSGNISSDVNTTDYISAGPQYGFGLSYHVTKSFAVEVNNFFELNFNKENFKTSGKDPVISTYSFSLNGIYNFRELFKKSDISPFIKGGVGLYRWKHLDDAPWSNGGVINANGSEQEGVSFGFNAGLGADYSLSNFFALSLILNYSMYFPKDEEKFGKDFTEQGSFTPQLKLTYYLPAFFK